MGLLSSLSNILTRRSNNLYDTLVLTNPNQGADLYGKSVAISGNYAVVGSCETTLIGTSGTAYIYDLASKTPNVPLFTLNHPDPEQLMFSDNFSWSVDIDGTVVVVGAEAEQGEYWETEYDYELQPNSGKVHIYDIMGETIVDAITLSNPIRKRPCGGTFYGAQVSICGDKLLVGTRRERKATNNVEDIEYALSKAYLCSASTGNLLYTLSNPYAPNTNEYYNFGSAMAIDKYIAAVGAYGNDIDDLDWGSPQPEPEPSKVHVYDTGSGSLRHVFENPNITGNHIGDKFGYALDVNEYSVAVGAPGEDRGSPQDDSGVVYLFTLPSRKVKQSAPIIVRGEDNDKHFGSSVKLTDEYLVVGAPNIDYTNQLDVGKIYVFKRDNLSTPHVIIENPSPKGISDSDHFGEQLSVSGNRIIANAKQERIGQDKDPGNVYVFEIK